MLSIWLGGAVIMSGYYVFVDRRACVQNEGFVKGLLWCESQPKTKMGESAYALSNFVKGALWPLHLGQYFFNSGNPNRQVEISSAENLGTSANMETKYSCGQFVTDIESNNPAAKQRIATQFAGGIFPEHDRKNELKLIQMATDYFGHRPSNSELKSFSAESLRLAIPACIFNRAMSVEEALFIGAESVPAGTLVE